LGFCVKEKVYGWSAGSYAQAKVHECVRQDILLDQGKGILANLPLSVYVNISRKFDIIHHPYMCIKI